MTEPSDPACWSFETAVRTIWQEARGEPPAGQQAVAHVIVNRLKTGRWGHTLASVCLYPFAFSGWLTHDPNRMAVAALPGNDPILVQLRTVLENAMNGEADPTGGALSYYAESMTTPPSWAATMTFCGQFGHQRFYK